MTDIARERVSTKILLILAQSVTNIFEYSNILVKNIYLHNVPGASVEGHSDFKVIWQQLAFFFSDNSTGGLQNGRGVVSPVFKLWESHERQEVLDRCTFESQDVGGYTVDAQEVGEHQSAICNQNSEYQMSAIKIQPCFQIVGIARAIWSGALLNHKRWEGTRQPPLPLQESRLKM